MEVARVVERELPVRAADRQHAQERHHRGRGREDEPNDEQHNDQCRPRSERAFGMFAEKGFQGGNEEPQENAVHRERDAGLGVREADPLGDDLVGLDVVLHFQGVRRTGERRFLGRRRHGVTP